MTAITVIICVKDDWRVMRLLHSLALQSLEPTEFEAVVVTTGDTDYGTRLTDFPFDVRRVESPQPRLSIARNRGLAAARGDLFLTTDADCVAHSELLSEIGASFAAAAEDTVGIGGAIGKHATDTLVRRYGITINDGQPALQFLPASPRPYITGANAAFRTAAVRAIGGYDERFACGEDVDVCYRLGMRGGRLEVNPRAIVYHEDRATLRGHFDRFRWYAVDQALLFKLYRGGDGSRRHFNGYPWRRVADAGRLLSEGSTAAAMVTLVEAAGVWVGDLEGSMRHRVIYL